LSSSKETTDEQPSGVRALVCVQLKTFQTVGRGLRMAFILTASVSGRLRLGCLRRGARLALLPLLRRRPLPSLLLLLWRRPLSAHLLRRPLRLRPLRLRLWPRLLL